MLQPLSIPRPLRQASHVPIACVTRPKYATSMISMTYHSHNRHYGIFLCDIHRVPVLWNISHVTALSAGLRLIAYLLGLTAREPFAMQDVVLDDDGDPEADEDQERHDSDQSHGWYILALALVSGPRLQGSLWKDKCGRDAGRARGDALIFGV